MSATPRAKLCRICGADCAGRPRIKDPKGRYYCKACYERARAGSAKAAPALDADDDLLAGLVDDAPPAPAACPSCGVPMGAGAVLCVSCGYSTATGDALPATAVTAAPRAAPARQPAWPIVIGLLSMLLGAGGVLMNGAMMAGGLMQEGGAIAVVRTVLPLLLSLWLVIGGIGVFRRSQGGFASLRRWAVVKLALTVICAGSALAFTMGSAEVRARVAQQLGKDGAYVDSEFIVLVLLAGMLWAIAWPVFLLIWFSRAGVTREVESW